MIVKPSLEDLVTQAWASVTAATGLTNQSESAVAYNIVRATCQLCYDLYGQLELAEQQSQLSTATGDNLDRIGTLFGMSRLPAQAASTVGGALAVKFTNSGLTPILVPALTRVWPDGDIDRAYYTQQDVTIGAGLEAYVDVTAAHNGTFYNVAAGQLTRHSLPVATLSVTNILPIASGQGVETDVNFRARIARQIAVREGSNAVALRQACLQVPGVRDVEILPGTRGAGTVDVLVLGYDRELPDTILAAVQTALEDAAAAGISVVAKAPRTIPVDVDIYLTLRAGADAPSTRLAASTAAHGYLDNLPIEDGSGNGTLLYMELAARIQQASPDIIDSQVSLTIDDLPALRSNQVDDPGDRFISRTINVR